MNDYAQFCALMAQVIPAFLIAYAIERQTTATNGQATDNLSFDLAALGFLCLGELLALLGAFRQETGEIYAAVTGAVGAVGVLALALHFWSRWMPAAGAARRVVIKDAAPTVAALAVVVVFLTFGAVRLGG